jgi:His-Xaa-Ser system radical SAM maturase HxsB
MKQPILKKIDNEKVHLFRFKKLDKKHYLITSDVGEYAYLTERDFERFLSGKVRVGSSLYTELEEKGFIRNSLNFNKLIDQWKSRNLFLWSGPSLHIVVTTLRCDHRCVYCQTSSKHENEKKYDMSLKTAKNVVDCIFKTPNNSLNIEFQGGEPLLNWPVVKYVVEYARKKEKLLSKRLQISLVSNFSTLNKSKLDFLLKHKVLFCTSLDGPEEIHNFNRVFNCGNSYKNTMKWAKEISRRNKNKPSTIDALLTVTRKSLKYPKEIIDEYRKIGTRSVFVRPLTPLGMAKDTWSKIGYSTEEFLKFYEKALDYIVELNAKKPDFMENTAVVFAERIFMDISSNFMDLRSPCGAGIGQIAYNYDGKVFTCDEGRMLFEMGDPSFCIGDVSKNTYEEIINHPAVKCLATSSCLDLQTSCCDCAYKPYCGTCPILNYACENDLFGHMPQNLRCKINRGILDIIFKKIRNPKYYKVVLGWVKLKHHISDKK